MAIQADGIAFTIGLWANEWDKIELDEDPTGTPVSKVPITEEETGFLRSTAFFAHDEANFHIERVRTYAGTTLIAENVVDIIKTDRHSLTVIRKDNLEEGA